MTAQQLHAALTAAGDLNANTIKILLLLEMAEDEMQVFQLAAQMDVTAPAVTRNLDTLQAMGLVKRRRDEEGDRRRVYVSLTSKGMVFNQRMTGQ